MATALSRYGFISAKLKTRVSTLLPETKLDELIRAKSLQEAFLPLVNTDFEPLGRIYGETGDLKAVEAALFSMEAKLFSELFPFLKTPALEFIQAMARFPEIEVIKSTLRLWFDVHVRGRTIDDRTGHLFHGQIVEKLSIDAIVNAGSAGDLAACFKGNFYFNTISKHIPDVLSSGSIFELESALDRLYFENLFSAFGTLDSSDRKSAATSVGIEVDIHNITCLIRLRTFTNLPGKETTRYLVDFGTSVSTRALAKAYLSDNFSDVARLVLGNRMEDMNSFWTQGDIQTRLAMLERMLRQTRTVQARRLLGGNPFTIGIVVACLVLKLDEMHSIRTVLNAKYYGLDEERIRSVL